MVTLYHPLPDLPVSKQKPLVLAIRTLIASGFVLGTGVTPANAELPVPTAAVTLTPTPVDIAIPTIPSLPVQPQASVSGQATVAVSGHAMTINQITDKATLDWKSFNIDKGYSVEFIQPSASSVALNNIHQTDASRILGSLTANGQVYLINQNGFLFGKDSQVNVNSLVASTLGISDTDFKTGITKVFDLNKNNSDYLTKAAALKGNGEIYLKNAQGHFVLDEAGQKVKIQVFLEAGASIKTNAPGGRVIIAAPTITNQGTIETPDGQTILAGATDKVYLQEAGVDSDIRGLLVEVGTGGDVNNVGKVLAERGNASLLGFAVNQQGIASATTSVQLNGSVRLLAHEGILNPSANGLKYKSTQRADGSTATVTLLGGSLTSVDLDSDKTATAIDAQGQTRSKIDISGHKIVLRNGSLVQAHAGDVTLTAVDDIQGKHDARIYLEAGSKVDVSGVKNVEVSAQRNVLNVELRKNELRDSPLQRDGVLYGKTVAVDIRDTKLGYTNDGTLATATIPIADVKGAVDRIARNIDERSTSGGSITLNSSGDVIAKAGSNLDISGGSVAYKAGIISTSKLVSGGQVYDIATADPNRSYDSIITQSHYDPGYVTGKAGGSLAITSYEAVLDGNLQAQTLAGALQRLPETRAVGSTLNLELSSLGSFSGQGVVFDDNAIAKSLGVNDQLARQNGGTPGQPAALLTINTGLLRNSGINNVNVKTSGSVTVTKDTKLKLPALGHLGLTAKNFDIQGAIISPSGTVDLQSIVVNNISQPSAITLGSSALIDVSGLWINDPQDIRLGHGLSAINIKGGSVNLAAEQLDLTLEKGSRINASGGAWQQSNAKITAGNGGSIKLSATSHDAQQKPGSLVINGDLSAWGLQQGGNLSLTTNEVIIGPNSAVPVHSGSTLKPLILAPDFFKQGGFSNYDITSNFYGLKVADNVQLSLQQHNLQLTSASTLAASGNSLLDISKQETLPDYLRNPLNLKLSFIELNAQNTQEALTIGKGALIQTDSLGSVELTSDTSIFVDGTINTPAGKIALTINPTTFAAGYLASQGIWLGADSKLLAQGAFDRQISINGLKTGDVLSGGTVQLAAKRGYIVTRAGSLIDVSGTTEKLDFLETGTSGGGVPLVKRDIASDAGSINFTTGEGILADGNFKATALGTGALGGSFTVAIDRNLRVKPDYLLTHTNKFPDDILATQPHRIELTTNDSNVLADSFLQGGAINDYSGRALLKSSRINEAGFDSLLFNTDVVTVNGQYTSGVLFNGDVELNAGRQIVFDTPSLQATNGHITLNTAYAELGSTQSQGNITIAPPATTGSGQLDVNAQAIELAGGLGFNGFNKVNLGFASTDPKYPGTGDLRFRGILNTTNKTYRGQVNLNGSLTLQAAQIYPGTLTDYTINVTGTGNDSVTILNSGAQALPVYSAGGKLTINAPNIYQKGTLKAPFGILSLNADKELQLAAGSLTSVSGPGITVPFGRVSGSTTWVYPLDNLGNSNIVIDTPPEKRLELNGKDVNLQAGATIDLSGGGDLYAYEFITGAGGSNDVLDPGTAGYSQKFAVLPGFNSALTPYDPLESASSGLANGTSAYLNAGAGLAAGWYTLLPAHYALLPGAYLVTPKAGTQDQYQTRNDLAGTAIVSGHYGVAGTDFQKARTQGFAIEPGTIARTRSQYTDYTANQFFANKAVTAGTALPQLPWDAGSLVINAKTSLSLAADLIANPVGKGLGGQVDISADRLEIVNRSEDLSSVASGTVGLLAGDLNKLNAPSLLLGGKRTKDVKGQRVTAYADKVQIDSGVNLKGQEILLTAINEVKVVGNAVVESIGKSDVSGGTLLLDNKNGTSDSALLRVSALGQVDVLRDKAINGNGGILTVESGARLKAKGSMLLDSSKNTIFDGIIDMQGGSLALNSSRISVGAAPVNTPGLVLANTQFHLDDLRLKSAHDFDIYGAASFDSKQVSISAATINGFNNTGALSSITAFDLIKFSNQGATTEHTGTGNGELAFNAREIELGSGQYALNGFNKVSFNATEGINGIGQLIDPITGNSSVTAAGTLTVAGDILMNAGYFSGGNGSTTSIDATGHKVTLTSPVAVPANPNIGLGVRWSVIGDSITSNARFELSSGILDLNALNGDINLNSLSNIDLSGKVVAFTETYKASGAGSLALSAAQGDINLAAGAKINLAGATYNGHQVSNAGLLTVKAGNGQFNWDGVIDAKGTATKTSDLLQGRFRLDVKSFGASAGAFTALNNKLVTAGFSEEQTLEQHSGDVSIASGDNIKAHQFQLAADQGAVSIAGAIDASGSKAGSVSIYGRNGITLASTGKITATATTSGSAGGSVTLDTVHQDDTGTGLLDLYDARGLIDVSPGTAGLGGTVHFRAGRDDTAHTVAVTVINSQIKGADPLRTALEATRIYYPADQGTITTTDIAAWQGNTTAFMNAKPVLFNHSGSTINFLPGIEVRSQNNLSLNNVWDFMDGAWDTSTASWNSNWHYIDSAGNKSLPGFLTLRATGDLNINATLTDAFANAPTPGQDNIIDGNGDPEPYIYHDLIQPGRSWSYNLIAGNNVNLANSYDFGQSQVMVRTGTGNIQIAAGGDIHFLKDVSNSKAAAAIYTMGTPASYTRGQLLAGTILGVPVRLNGETDQDYLNRLDSTQLNALLRYGYLDEMQMGFGYMFAEYPTQGGNINISAAGNIQGIQTGQQISDWQVRGGFWNNGRTDNRPTAWGIDVSGDVNLDGLTIDANGNSYHIRYFNQNIGALGGGNVNVQAGADVRDLSVMLPTTGKPFGGMSNLDQWNVNGAIINGGGDLQVTAGNDIVGGEYYVGLGRGSLIAGGSIAKGTIPRSTSTIGGILDVGDAKFDVQARKDLNLATAMNPTMIEQTVLPDKGSQYDTRFFSYGPNSGINLISTAGNVALENDFNAIKTLKNMAISTPSKFEYTLYPGTVKAAALSGDIRINNSMTLFPSSVGDLAFLANGNIGSDKTSGNNHLYINMSDTDPANLPGISNPATEVEGSGINYLAQELLNPASSVSAKLHAANPLHQGDQSLPLIEAKYGNIAFPANLLATFYLPQASTFRAGKDISNLSILAQNLSASDVTLINAGRDIGFTTDRDSNGKIITSTSTSQYFKLAGPGQLQVLAGRNISLGGSDGIQTIGNLLNQALAGNGASINVLAGLADKVDYAGFINKYQATYGVQLQGLSSLSVDQQRKHLSVLLTILFQEIKQSAAAAAAAPENQRAALYKRGFDAIQAMFPGQDYAGNLSLVFSQIKTLAGGDINLAVPGGKIDVGLAGKQGGVSKGADQLGIVVQQQGDLNILTSGDVNVNQSRVFTMGGGNIAAWSSKGSIDAGKGAKSAISAPKPVTTIDPNGNITTRFPKIFSGSGIQAIGGGNVTLAAPVGVVDAGEAGISGGQIVIAATAVIGASNIQSSGGTVGVPATVSAPVGLSGGDSAATSASKTATQSSSDNNSNSSDNAKDKQKSTVSILSADVVGFGDCSVSDVKDATTKCGGG